MKTTDKITLDTETGGLNPSKHALLSIGATCSWMPSDGEQTFEIYVTAASQPGKTVEPQAAEKNGYTESKWLAKGAVPVRIAIRMFLLWLEARKNEKKGAVLICHHLAFDKPFLQEAAYCIGLELPHRNHWRCTQVMFGTCMDLDLVPPGSSGLDRLATLAGLKPRRGMHNALQDAEMTMHAAIWLEALLLSKWAEPRRLHLDLSPEKNRGGGWRLWRWPVYATAIFIGVLLYLYLIAP